MENINSNIIYKTISLTSNSSGWYDCTSEIPNGYVCVNVLPITQDYWLSGGVTGALRNVYPDSFAKDVTITARLTCVK